jgi:hypothetical protein
MKKLKLKLTGTTGPLTPNQMKKIYGGGQDCIIVCCQEGIPAAGFVRHDTCPSQSTADSLCNSQIGHSGHPAWMCTTNEYPGGWPCHCDTY